MPVDIVAFGPHPDDIEIGLGATIATHVDRGLRVGLCDLTRGELGSNGTVEERAREAAAAAEVLGVAWRDNLAWPDGGIGGDLQLREAVAFIRRCRPGVVVVPHWEDRHPDHVAASKLLTEAVFRSGLRRYDVAGGPWRPDWVCYYCINDISAPSFVLDVSSAYDRKRQALRCYRTQFFAAGEGSVATRLTAVSFFQMIEARDAHAGALVGAAFAEGVVVKEPLVRPTLLKHPAPGPQAEDEAS